MGKGSGSCTSRPALSIGGTEERSSPADVVAARVSLGEMLTDVAQTHQGSLADITDLVDKSGLTWKDVRTPSYNPQWNLAMALTQAPTSITVNDVTTTAVRHRAMSLEDAAASLQQSTTVVISDVHGNVQLLQQTLNRLGILDGDRRVFDGTVVQIGDLVDGREGEDVECLKRGLEWCDVVIAGNHEAAYLDGPTFDGQFTRPDLATDLRRALWNDTFRIGYVADGVLLTHAGVPSDNEDPEATLAAIEDQWNSHCGRPEPRNPMLFGIDAHRGGSAGIGGILWGGWQGRFGRQSAFPQIVGHTPLGLTEQSPDNQWHDIDLAGGRLGVALIDNGSVNVAHSTVIS